MDVDSTTLDHLGRPVSAAEIEAFIARLAVESPASTDAERIDRMGALEGLKAAAAAAQVDDIVTFADSQLEDQAARGVRAKDRGNGIPSQIGLACRHSPHRAGRMLTTARALASDLPCTLVALRRGETTEHRATMVAKETSILDSEQRRHVDSELGPRLHELGDRQVEAEARRWTCRLAPDAVAERASKARHDRCVTIRPAPDTMTYLTGLLPVEDGVAVYAALDAAAKAAAAAGDTRSRGQVMADTLVERITGAAGRERPIEISVIMTDRTLFGEGDEPAHVPGYGPIPAEVARRWILSVLDLDGDHNDDDDDHKDDDEPADERARQRRARRHKRGKVWLRRLYTAPGGRELVAMDSRRRSFPGQLRRLVKFRDQTCATPFCGAPIRHIDHIDPVRNQGATSYANARGTCERCNHAKEAPGWSASVHARRAGSNTQERVVALTTPTGHSYSSRPLPAHQDPGFEGERDTASMAQTQNSAVRPRGRRAG